MQGRLHLDSLKTTGNNTQSRRPDGSVGMALVLPALTDCRWWFESLLVHSGVSSATRRKATGADHTKMVTIHSPASTPINTKRKKEQANKQNTQNHKQNQKQTKKHGEVGSLPALRNEMHDNILCVSMSMATEKEQNTHNTEKMVSSVEGTTCRTSIWTR